jgi:hypothetical protein
MNTIPPLRIHFMALTKNALKSIPNVIIKLNSTQTNKWYNVIHIIKDHPVRSSSTADGEKHIHVT